MAKFRVTLRRMTVEEQVVEVEAEDAAEAEEIAADEADDDEWKSVDGDRDDDVSVEDVEDVDEDPEACPACGKKPGEGVSRSCEHPEGCDFQKDQAAAARPGWSRLGSGLSDAQDGFRRDGTEIVVRKILGTWRIVEDGTLQHYLGGQGSKKLALFSSAEDAQKAVEAELLAETPETVAEFLRRKGDVE